MLRTLTDKEKETWKDHLPQVIHAYNCTRHESTGYSPHFLLFGCHPRLPVDLLFGLAEQTDPVSHKGYAEKWRQRMTEAYQIANKNSLSASAKGKSHYDQKVRGVVLKPGDRVLVRNLGERGGPGKLRSYWENRIYVVRDQVSDNPVYVVHPEGEGQGRTRTLHRNLLLLVNDLPVEFPQKVTPKPTRRRANVQVRVKSRDEQTGNTETSDSDDDSCSGYWLRRLPTGTEPRTGPVRQTQVQPTERSVQSLRGYDEIGRRMPVTETADIVEDLPDMAEVHEGGQSGREGQVEPETGPTIVDDVVMEEAGQDEWQLKSEAETHQNDLQSRDSPAALNLPQSDAEPESPQRGSGEEQITDLQSRPSTPLRRSTRLRRPAQRLTYSSLGHPTYQSRPTVNTVETHQVPSADLWIPQPYLPFFQGPPFIQFPYLFFFQPICSY